MRLLMRRLAMGVVIGFVAALIATPACTRVTTRDGDGPVDGASGESGARDVGGSGGAAEVSGAGGLGGLGGFGVGDWGGSGGSGGSGCTHPEESRASALAAHGFDAYEGMGVEAAFAASLLPDLATSNASVADGRFHFEFRFPVSSCSTGPSPHGGGAAYLDANGNGRCDLASDLIFVWAVHFSYPRGPLGEWSQIFEATPMSPRCSLEFAGSTGNDHALVAARHLCPELGDCLDFCEPRGADDLPETCPVQPDAGVDEDAGVAAAEFTF